MTAVSQSVSGRPSESNKHYWASILFTRLCTSSVSLLLLLPRNPQVRAKFEHWDFSAVAALGRQIIECYFAYFYLCVDLTSEDEWQSRWNLFNLHDCMSRKRMFENFGSDAEKIKGFIQQAEELKSLLKTNAYFLLLEEKKRNEFLKGNSAYLLSQDEIIDRMGDDATVFRGMYRFLSAHVHSFPLSFYRIGEEDRGRGLENHIDKSYICITLELLDNFLTRATREMGALFPGSSDGLSEACRKVVFEQEDGRDEESV